MVVRMSTRDPAVDMWTEATGGDTSWATPKPPPIYRCHTCGDPLGASWVRVGGTTAQAGVGYLPGQPVTYTHPDCAQEAS